MAINTSREGSGYTGSCRGANSIVPILGAPNIISVEPTTVSYIGLALAAIFGLPAFGRRVLAFLRDLDDYRANRPRK